METFVTNELDQQDRLWRQTLLIEDNFSRARRSSEHFLGVAGEESEALTITLHRIMGNQPEVVKPRIAHMQASDSKNCCMEAALSLLDEALLDTASVVTAGSNYGGSAEFMRGIQHRRLGFAIEIPASQAAQLLEEGTKLGGADFQKISQLSTERTMVTGWTHVAVKHPVSEEAISYAAARIGFVQVHGNVQGWLSALQIGAIMNSQRGMAFVLTTEPNVSFEELVRVAGWVRWIKPYTRKQLRPESHGVAENSRHWSLRAIRPSAVPAQDVTPSLFTLPSSSHRKPIRVVELFAGAGGMGLGFFMANDRPPVQLLYSGEVHPVYAETLRINHGVLAGMPENLGMLPNDTEAADLRSPEAKRKASAAVGEAGVDIVIGGPPCQGFSSANRHSWHGGNPHNLLIDTYLEYVAQLQPKIFVMENVQGIVSSPKAGQQDSSLSVLDYFAQQMTEAGYQVFPKLLDASRYGVPQRRNRCFIVGLREDLGHGKGSFGSWGPFPQPTHGPGTGRKFVTVWDAIGDLPQIGNGEDRSQQHYTAPAELEQRNPFLQLMRDGEKPNIVTDHITSRHADYVIERYRRIPAGGNWQDIRDQLTNYASAGRTHSNIYRRLDPDEPSITIGHYRKSMIVHPAQARGLSLREAARLQSFPDWFRFAGKASGQEGKDALGNKQQQLANAVCPLVTKALAEFLFDLIR